MSRYELERRAGKNDRGAMGTLRREKLMPGVLAVRDFLMLALALVFIGIAMNTYGIWQGIWIIAIAALMAKVIGRITALGRLMNELFTKIEIPVLNLAEKLWPFLKIFTDVVNEISSKADSKEELKHIIKDLDPDVVSADEKTIIMAVLEMESKTVKNVMRSKNDLVTVDKSDVLGPLVLDKLAKTTFSHFPVVEGDINHVVGMLKLGEQLDVSNKKSPSVGEVMDKKVYFIDEGDSLQEALGAFVKEKYHFFIVIDEERETVGFLTLRRLLESLLGKEVSSAGVKTKKESVKKMNNPKYGVDV